MTTAELKKDSKVNKELKAEFLTKLFDNYKCSDKWKAYYTKDIEDVCRINDKDEYFFIDKPYIKKSFCFAMVCIFKAQKKKATEQMIWQ